MVIVSSANPSMQLIMATAPPDWFRAAWPWRDANAAQIILCEENTFPIPPGPVGIVLDSVRYPKGFLQSLPNRMITLDAPQEGCTFMWTPIRAELFKPKPWDERKGVICPVRLKNYPMRQKAVKHLEKMGVKIIERDDEKRSYQDYVNDLCSAKAVVNFCRDRKTGQAQLKGRVFETLTAGALLFEERNYCTAQTLPRSIYYDWCDDFAELDVLVDAFSNDRIGEQTAAHGLAVARDFSAEKFWAVVEKFAE